MNNKMKNTKTNTRTSATQWQFNIYGLLLFATIMLPNIIWFLVPAKNDILRTTSATPIIDIIASIFQVIMVIGLCFVKKKHCRKYDLLSIICIAAYFACWIFYYCAIVNSALILGLCLFPCLAFIFYEIRIKNYFALMPTIIFTILHLIFGIKNFLI